MINTKFAGCTLLVAVNMQQKQQQQQLCGKFSQLAGQSLCATQIAVQQAAAYTKCPKHQFILIKRYEGVRLSSCPRRHPHPHRRRRCRRF